jgi:hypothetical protein
MGGGVAQILELPLLSPFHLIDSSDGEIFFELFRFEAILLGLSVVLVAGEFFHLFEGLAEEGFEVIDCAADSDYAHYRYAG